MALLKKGSLIRGTGSIAPPQPVYAPRFDGLTQYTEAQIRLVDVDNLSGLTISGFFSATGDGTMWSQTESSLLSSREFQVYMQYGDLKLVLGGIGSTIASGLTLNGFFELSFNESTVSFYNNGNLVSSAPYAVGSSREPGAKFRAFARGSDGGTTFYHLNCLSYNHKVRQVSRSIDYSWQMDSRNSESQASTPAGNTMTIINHTNAMWVEV